MAVPVLFGYLGWVNMLLSDALSALLGEREGEDWEGRREGGRLRRADRWKEEQQKRRGEKRAGVGGFDSCARPDQCGRGARAMFRPFCAPIGGLE